MRSPPYSCPLNLTSWNARLELGFGSRPKLDGDAQARTLLGHNLHSGPLTVQKALYPEGISVCHVVIVHPPAGVAGGDQLAIDIRLDSNTHAVVSTPSATRWYRSNGKSSGQSVTIDLESDARFEWLPQENLIFNQANAQLSSQIRYAAGARAIGWEGFMLGRQASGEVWDEGRLSLATQFYRDGRLHWLENGTIKTSTTFTHSPCGLDGFPVFATLWAIIPEGAEELAQRISPLLPWDRTLRAGTTRPRPDLLLVRVLGHCMETVRHLLVKVWAEIRLTVLGVPPQPLRLWAS